MTYECPARKTLEDIKPHVKHREDVAEVCYDWCPACRIDAALAAPCPCEGLRAKLEASYDQRIGLHEDAVFAHKWFARHFGEIMNGRDFETKCAMADRILAEREQGG